MTAKKMITRHTLRIRLTENLEDIASKLPQILSQAKEIDLIVPASVVCLTQLSLPAKLRRQQLLKLLPFAVEDKIAVEPETVHIALGPCIDGKTSVAIIDKIWMKQALALFSPFKLRIKRILPETLLLPLSPQCWSIAWVKGENGEGEEGFIRTGEYTGQMLDAGTLNSHPSLVPLALRLLLKDAQQKAHAPTRILIYGEKFNLQHWSAELGIPVEQGAAWDWRTANTDRLALNLLQGEFAPTSSLISSFSLPQFRAAFILLILIASVQFLGNLADVWRLRNEKHHILNSMEQDFRLAFPEEKIVLDIPLQMQRKIDKLRRAAGQMTQDDFIPTLARQAPSLAKAQRIHYDKGVLKIDR